MWLAADGRVVALREHERLHSTVEGAAGGGGGPPPPPGGRPPSAVLQGPVQGTTPSSRAVGVR
ncbi:hypothetical protein Gobs01_04442 [Geodermatophilus obscurus DSM 43160]